jgi:hypothetical protein
MLELIARRLERLGLDGRARELVIAELLAPPLARRRSLGPPSDELAPALALARALTRELGSGFPAGGLSG